MKKFFEQVYENPVDVVGAIPINEGWELTLETLDDVEYTKKRIRNDLIAVFKVLVNSQGEIISYTREEIRERGKPVQNNEE